LAGLQFKNSDADRCLYVKNVGEKKLFILLYVDDLIIAYNNEEDFETILRKLKENFQLEDLGKVKMFLGIQVFLEEGHFHLCQKNYIEKLIERFGQQDSKKSKIPLDPGYLQQKEEDSKLLPDNAEFQSLIGSLLYVAVNTRPDISVAVSILGRKVQNPSQLDWNEAKRILKYLKGTADMTLRLGNQQEKLEIYVDADWAGDSRDRKSNSGFLFKFCGGLINWTSRKQKIVATSSTEAELIALADCCQEILWILKLLDSIGISLQKPLIVNEDNQSCIKMIESGKIDRKSKHIETKLFFVKELQEKSIIKLQYCPTEEMLADMLTKPLQSTKLCRFREAIGLTSMIEEE
jgi:hypothetical protein